MKSPSVVCIPIVVEKVLIFVIFQLVQLIQVFALQPIFMCTPCGLRQGFFYDRGRWRGLLGDDPMLAEDIIPSTVNMINLISSLELPFGVRVWVVHRGVHCGRQLAEQGAVRGSKVSQLG
jgi:hypothetical protein